MARIRTVKPEFWTSAQVLECSTNARLMFVGLWTFSDDKGRHPASEKQIKAEIFPADDFTQEDIRGYLNELSDNGLIKTYVVEKREYLEILGWHHQRIDKPQPAKYPGPLQESSENDTRTIPPDSIGKDTIVNDRKGRDTKGNGASRASRFVPPSLQEITDYCQSRRSTVDPKVFHEYFTESNWHDSKGNKVRSWKQKVITWESHGGAKSNHVDNSGAAEEAKRRFREKQNASH